MGNSFGILTAPSIIFFRAIFDHDPSQIENAYLHRFTVTIRTSLTQRHPADGRAPAPATATEEHLVNVTAVSSG